MHRHSYGPTCRLTRQGDGRPGRPAGLVWLLALAFAVLSPLAPRAHEIPADVRVQVLIKPVGNVMRVLVRAPLASMQDIVFPERGPGYLDIPQAESALRRAATVWVAPGIQGYETDMPLNGLRLAAVQVSAPSDRSFSDYDRALAHVLGPGLPADTQVVWQQALLDALFEYPIQSEASDFSVNLTLARLGLRTQTTLRFVRPDGTERIFDYRGDAGLIRLDPRWYQAARQFALLGFEHITDGIDHLLFLACLIIPFRRARPLVAVVTSFTVAHSVTLIASAFGFVSNALWFQPLVETLIAVSIVYMALENAIGKPRRRWMSAFGFGLVHGFGFGLALREPLQFAGGHVLASQLAFNLGIEFGQGVILALLLPALWLLFRFVVPERVGAFALSALILHRAWHWMTERWTQLGLYDFQFGVPAFDLALLAAAMRWGTLVLIVGTLVWLMSMVFPQMERDIEPQPAARD